MRNRDNKPRVVYLKVVSFLLGLIYFKHVIIDRIPQIEARFSSPRKYKTLIFIRFFHLKYSLVIRSALPGIVTINGKEL